MDVPLTTRRRSEVEYTSSPDFHCTKYEVAPANAVHDTSSLVASEATEATARPSSGLMSSSVTVTVTSGTVTPPKPPPDTEWLIVADRLPPSFTSSSLTPVTRTLTSSTFAPDSTVLVASTVALEVFELVMVMVTSPVGAEFSRSS